MVEVALGVEEIREYWVGSRFLNYRNQGRGTLKRNAQEHIEFLLEIVDRLRCRIDAQWVSVKDRLPSRYDRVAVLCWDVFEPQVSHITVRNYHDAAGEIFEQDIWDGVVGQVTHWCPLPPVPEE